MSKRRYVCRCGYSSDSFLGRCPACGEWSSFREIRGGVNSSGDFDILKLNQIEERTISKISSGIDELDRVVSGGFVSGGSYFFGGQPGSGKSTLSSQIAGEIAKTKRVIYLCGEESPEMVKSRMLRLGISATNQNLFLLANAGMSAIRGAVRSHHPDFLIIDSIQSVFCEDLDSTGIKQLIEGARRLSRLAISSKFPILIIGHFTKEDKIAGPRQVEHLFDALLLLEGDRSSPFRFLKTEKHRFGPTDEVGFLEMTEKGLIGLSSPEEKFRTVRKEAVSGAISTFLTFGSRIISVEIQCLVRSGKGRRVFVGLDRQRCELVIAVLERYAGFDFEDYDILLSVSGGLSTNAATADLAVALAIVGSYEDLRISDFLGYGEISLTGEVKGDPPVKKARSAGLKLIQQSFENEKIENIVKEVRKHARSRKKVSEV